MLLDIDHSEPHPCYRIVQHPLGDTWPKRSINRLRKWAQSGDKVVFFHTVGVVCFLAPILIGLVGEHLMGGIDSARLGAFGLTFLPLGVLILMFHPLAYVLVYPLLFGIILPVLSFLHLVVLGIRRMCHPAGRRPPRYGTIRSSRGDQPASATRAHRALG